MKNNLQAFLWFFAALVAAIGAVLLVASASPPAGVLFLITLIAFFTIPQC